MMSKYKPAGIRARAGRAWDRAFGSSPPSPSPSTQGLPPAAPSPAAFGPPEAAQPLLSIATPIVSAPTPAVPSIEVPPPPAFTLQSPPLRVPPELQNPPPTSSGGATWSGLNTALRTLHESAALFPSLQSSSARSQKEYETLALELKMMSETLDRHLQGSKSVSNVDSIVKIVQSIQEKVDFIAKTQNSNLGARLLKAEQLAEALSTCDRLIQILCRQLQLDAGLSMATEQKNAQLEKLKPAKLAPYDSSLAMEINRRTCTENTRTGVLSDINDWLDDPNSPNVCWMNGMAGTGKTTIAYTFAEILDKKKRLAASFFCTRTTTECQDVARIVPSIAYQLARHSAPFLSAICGTLRDDPDILARTMSTQFEKILKDPLLAVKDAVPSGLVVVVDALDECAASNGVRLVLDMLLREAPNLPLKFFVTSRPEPIIRNKIQEQPEGSRSVYELHNVRQSDVQADIELYLQAELPSVAHSQIRQLAKQSGSLFIYAATAVRYIRGGNIQARLARMLSVGSVSTKGYSEIDKLYTTILLAALNADMLEDDEEESMKLVLWTVVCAQEPISVQTLAALTGINDPQKVLEALEPLRSIIYVSENSNIVAPLHASFPDFMFNPARSLAFACDSGQHNQLMAQQCFKFMQDHLHFNICGLESSYGPDKMVPDLEKRIDGAVPPTLAYIYRYWADHLQKAPASEELHAALEDFLLKYLLFWMEVMNLKGWIELGVWVVLRAKLWIMNNHPSSRILPFAEDAQRFIASFAANIVSRCTPHIYLSHLPFYYRSNSVYKHYEKEMHGLIRPKGTLMETRYEAMIAGWNLDSEVLSVAYSPNGALIAIGCSGGTVLVKNAHLGTLVSGPLKGHADRVLSVAFSPDGTRIASGSGDYTVRIWNVEDGTPAAAPFEGHARHVTSVIYSPDGTRIASGSEDCTVRMWNAEDGSPIGVPFEGHTDSILSVAFSPDGTHIVSGSCDCTVRMWNAEDGTPVGTPFEGHTEFISSVIYSPDGTRIASGSVDCTVRMWDAKDGSPTGAHFGGHTAYINSVAFHRTSLKNI